MSNSLDFRDEAADPGVLTSGRRGCLLPYHSHSDCCVLSRPPTSKSQQFHGAFVSNFPLWASGQPSAHLECSWCQMVRARSLYQLALCPSSCEAFIFTFKTRGTSWRHWQTADELQEASVTLGHLRTGVHPWGSPSWLRHGHGQTGLFPKERSGEEGRLEMLTHSTRPEVGIRPARRGRGVRNTTPASAWSSPPPTGRKYDLSRGWGLEIQG